MSYRSFSLIPTTLNNNLLTDRFSQIDNWFSRVTGEKPLMETPAYNLLQKDKEHYEMIISVPGYTQDEIDVSVLNNQLTISSKYKLEEPKITNNQKESDNVKWLHYGFKKNYFLLSFNLEHKITITSANLDKGLLILQFTYNIPEEDKPQKISITEKSNKVIEHNH